MIICNKFKSVLIITQSPVKYCHFNVFLCGDVKRISAYFVKQKGRSHRLPENKIGEITATGGKVRRFCCNFAS